MLTRVKMAEQSGPQFEHVIEVKTPTDEFTLRGRPCQLSAFSYVPRDRKLTKERTYFNVNKNVRNNNHKDT